MARSRWALSLASGAVVVWLAGCGALTGSSPTSAPAAPAPTVAPTVARAPASAVPSAAPSPSPSPPPAAAPATAAPAARAQTVYVGNTDNQGVYVRRTPAMADRVRAYPDKTALAVIGDDVDAEGQKWKHIRTPDGLEGYVPAMYTVDTPP
jgi:hypothetical protein